VGWKPYPSDVGDAEWALVAPYLTLLLEGVPQRAHSLREAFDALRWLVRAGASWRRLPHDLPPWPLVDQQTQRWLAAGVFEDLVADQRRVLRLAAGRGPEPTAAILDSRTLQSTPERGGRAGYGGAKRRKGAKGHVVVDTLGHLPARPARHVGGRPGPRPGGGARRGGAGGDRRGGRDRVRRPGLHGRPARAGGGGARHRAGSGQAGRRQARLRAAAPALGGGALLGLARFRRLARDDERPAQSLAGFHLVASAVVMATRLIRLFAQDA